MNLNGQSNYSASRLDLFASEVIKVTKTTQKDFLLVEPYSIGDAVHTLSLVNAFREKHCRNGEKIHFLCNERSLPLVKIFNNIDYAVGANLGPFEYQLEALAERYGPVPIGRPIPMPPDMYARGWFGRLCAAGVIHPLVAKKLILELELDTRPYVPVLDQNIRQKMDEKAQSLGLERDSVIIFNHANTMREMDAAIFLPVKKIWGDRVYYDASVDQKGVVNWAKPIKMSIEEVPYFSNFAGSVLCIRSGITDLLAFSDASVITFYPNQSMLYDWSGDKIKMMQVFKGMTLENLGLTGRCKEYPVFCEDLDNVDTIADKLKTLLSMHQFSVKGS